MANNSFFETNFHHLSLHCCKAKLQTEEIEKKYFKLHRKYFCFFSQEKNIQKRFFFFKALFFSYKGQAFNTVAQIAYDLWSPSENKNPIKSEISWLRTGCLKTIYHHQTKVPRKLLSLKASKGCINCIVSRVILYTLY